MILVKTKLNNKIFTFDENNQKCNAITNDPLLSLSYMIKYDLKY